MASIERLTITLPAEMAALVKGAVAEGDYASTSEVVREALRDWEIKAEIRRRKLETLRRDIDEGLKDAEAGRLVDPDLNGIMVEGRRLSPKSKPSV